MSEMVPPTAKYQTLTGREKALVDTMIERLLAIMRTDAELAADVAGIVPGERRPAVIGLMDAGFLKLVTDRTHLWWDIYVGNGYIPIDGTFCKLPSSDFIQGN